MTRHHRRTRRPVARLSARLAPAIAVVLVAVGAQAIPAAALPDPRGAALEWFEQELAADGGAIQTAYVDAESGDTDFSADWGLTIDLLLGLAADGRSDDAAAVTALGLVEDNAQGYAGSSDRYAGSLAKMLLLAQVVGVDPTDFGGLDLEAELLARLQATGPDAGRFSDRSGFGDFSNGIGQALAVIALGSTEGGAPASSVDFLLQQQCPSGGFRGDYTASGGCVDDTAATIDATGLALQALTATAPTCAVRRSVTDGIAYLLDEQVPSGGFGGETGVNSNTTGLAAGALRALGQTAAADAAAGFVSSLQLQSGDDLGAIALNEAVLATAADGIAVLERDAFRRASGQAVLALGLPSYAELAGLDVDPAAFSPCAEPPPGPRPAPTVTLSSTSVVAGGTITVGGSGFDAGEQVRVDLVSTARVLGTLLADSAGRVEGVVTIPADLEPGDHRVELRGLTSGSVVSIDLEVLAAPAAPGTLPATGTSTDVGAPLGLGLVLLGGTLVEVGRRRRGALVVARGRCT